MEVRGQHHALLEITPVPSEYEAAVPQSWSGRFGLNNLPLPGFEPRIV